MSNYGLGREQLNSDEVTVYALLEEALLNKASLCDISHIKRNVDIMHVLLIVLGDNPNIVYFNKTRIRTVASIFGKQLNFVGCMSKAQAKQCEDKLHKVLEGAVWEIDKNAKNDKDILQGISEYLQRNVSYDKDELMHVMNGCSKHPESHNAYGALVNHNAVCDGFSSAYALIAQYFDFRCMVVYGKSSYRRNAKVEHAWNIVEYEGDCFHIDSTWDANTYETIKTYSYDYFGLDDDEISLDHEWDYRKTPKCNSSKLSYYKSNNLYAYSEAQIEELLCKALKRGEKTTQIKISLGIGLPANEIKYLEGKIMMAASEARISGGFDYSWQEKSRCLIVVLNG